ncbi:canalicular multispecific organic anion transporter 1-like [Centruroides sculpturatus]|nr:canalicular multispecific organic anion transporter 1-like [Centruroides sculpturatus]
MNLDPWDEHDDDSLWSALEHSHLKNFVSSLPHGLEYELTEGGSNISAGQRQLLCLARALLRRTRILFLDEATASVDLETDQFVHNTIREVFSHCTIITIAHRLHTVIECDRIIVLSNGCIVEDGPPQRLLRDSSSYFYSMARDAGLT